MANKHLKAEVAVGVGLAAVAAAIAGGYYFYGKHGAKHRKNLKSWSVKARGEIMEKMEAMQKVSRENYHEVVAQVLNKYKNMKHIDPAELRALAQELKGHWDGINQTLAKAAKSTRKIAKKARKK